MRPHVSVTNRHDAGEYALEALRAIRRAKLGLDDPEHAWALDRAAVEFLQAAIAKLTQRPS